MTDIINAINAALAALQSVSIAFANFLASYDIRLIGILAVICLFSLFFIHAGAMRRN